jgi:hypothetical protein
MRVVVSQARDRFVRSGPASDAHPKRKVRLLPTIASMRARRGSDRLEFLPLADDDPLLSVALDVDRRVDAHDARLFVEASDSTATACVTPRGPIAKIGSRTNSATKTSSVVIGQRVVVELGWPPEAVPPPRRARGRRRRRGRAEMGTTAENSRSFDSSSMRGRRCALSGT